MDEVEMLPIPTPLQRLYASTVFACWMRRPQRLV